MSTLKLEGMLIVLAWSAVLLKGIDIPGIHDRFEARVCRLDPDYTLECSTNYDAVLFVHSVRAGYTSSYATDQGHITCPSDEPVCDAEVVNSDIYRGSSYASYTIEDFPDQDVYCDGHNRQANYLVIEYSCIYASLPNTVDITMATQLTDTYNVHLTTPNWPSGSPSDLTGEYTCSVRPNNAGGKIYVYLMYVDFPENSACGEEIRITRQDGSEVVGHCSPYWRVNTVASTEESPELTVTFRRTTTNIYVERSTKVWIYIEGSQDVECFGATGSPGASSAPPVTMSSSSMEQPVQPNVPDEETSRKEIRLCGGQVSYLQCPYGQYIYGVSAKVGYTNTINHDVDSGSYSCPPADVPCEQDLTEGDIYRATSYQAYSGVAVPAMYVRCPDGDFQMANYFRVYYSCISEYLPNEIEICSSTTLVPVQSAHITNPGWADGTPDQLLNCECRVEPVNSERLNIQATLEYVDFPEEVVCGEELQVYDSQLGTSLLSYCSPGWQVNLSMSASVEGLAITFNKDYSNVYENRKTKLRLSLEGDSEMNITCESRGVTQGGQPFPVQVVAGVCGGGVLIIIIIILVAFLVKRRQKSEDNKEVLRDKEEGKGDNPKPSHEFSNHGYVHPSAPQSPIPFTTKPLPPTPEESAGRDLPRNSLGTDSQGYVLVGTHPQDNGHYTDDYYSEIREPSLAEEYLTPVGSGMPARQLTPNSAYRSELTARDSDYSYAQTSGDILR